MPADRRLGFDLDPRHHGVIEGNFLEQSIPAGDLVVVGNPPFGKNASLAVRFFNHCAGARIIAMIVPRTFRKPSVINRLDPAYHLVSDETLAPFSFVFEGQPYDVPCCFQIWERRDYQRLRITAPSQHDDFAFVKRGEGDFAVQRVGARAGAVKTISDKIADASHYFIRGGEDVRKRFETLDYEGVKHDTAGNPSISKPEIVALYSSSSRI
jgi:hypothetical protein